MTASAQACASLVNTYAMAGISQASESAVPAVPAAPVLSLSTGGAGTGSQSGVRGTGAAVGSGSSGGPAPTAPAPLIFQTATPRITPALLAETKHGAGAGDAIAVRPVDQRLLIQGSDPQYPKFDGTASGDWSITGAFTDDSTLQHKDQTSIVLDSAQMSGIALSVGVVWWASRVTGVIGSLLASMPAWRQLDPLPVVGRDDEDAEAEWGEADAHDTEEIAISMVLDGSPRAASIAA